MRVYFILFIFLFLFLFLFFFIFVCMCGMCCVVFIVWFLPQLRNIISIVKKTKVRFSIVYSMSDLNCG